MKPYHELTRLGRLRRLRKLAETALVQYGLKDAKLTFQHYGGNVIFRVDLPGGCALDGNDDYYVPNRYNLRILTMDHQQFTESEMTWLATLRNGARLPVPEPIPTLDGRLITRITNPGVPQGKLVSLMRWVDGRQLDKHRLRPDHAEALGTVIGRMHRFASAWTPPNDFKRFHWDWYGLLGNSVLRTPVEDLITSMPVVLQKPFKHISQQAKKIMDVFGKSPNAYGMIHSDLFLENVLFKSGIPLLIDFEDCGFGYWMLDIGVALTEFRWMNSWPQIRDAFLSGYTKMHPLPEIQLDQLNLFMAIPNAINVLWASEFILEDPAMRTVNEKWRDTDGEKLLRFADLV